MMQGARRKLHVRNNTHASRNNQIFDDLTIHPEYETYTKDMASEKCQNQR